MARFLKNPDIANGAQAARLPIVPSSAYGDAPTNGLIRFNQATNRIEFYYNGAWSQIAKIGSVQIVVGSFISNKGVMVAALNDLAMIHNDDLVGLADG